MCRLRYALFAALLAVALGGCRGAPLSAAPPGTTLVPTRALPAPTTVPTATSVPTATPTATPTPLPIATPLPTVTPTPTPFPTATSSPPDAIRDASELCQATVPGAFTDDGGIWRVGNDAGVTLVGAATQGLLDFDTVA